LAFAVITFFLPLRSMPLGFFFGFDFLAEFFVFGGRGFARFVLVDFFDRNRFVLAFLAFVVGLGFVVAMADERGRRGDGRQAHGMGRGGRREQH
jgi:hypothetical protein